MLIIIKVNLNCFPLDLIVSYIMMLLHEYKGHQTQYSYIVVNSADIFRICWSASKDNLIALTYLA